jgi:hypothetical protein
MKRKISFFWMLVFCFLGGCISEKRESEIKDVVNSQFPKFEATIHEIINEKYGLEIYKKNKWEWKFEESRKNHEYEVKYGCFRELNVKEKLIGGFTENITSELSGGLISFNPKSEDKGVYITLIVNVENKTVLIKKQN